MTKQEWKKLRDDLTKLVQDFDTKYGQDNCSFALGFGGEDPDNCIVEPRGFKYKGFYVFSNEFFSIYVDGWYHNYYGYETEPAWRTDFPRGYKVGLQKVIKKFCEDHNLYYELRKAYRATVNSTANTCAFLIAINK